MASSADDRARYSGWVRDHQGDCWSLAVYLLRDAQEAEDAVQESYLRLWQRMDGMTDDHARPWLLRVVRNECIDRLRKRKPGEDTDRLLGGIDPEQQVASDEADAGVLKAIDELNEPYRSLIVMREVLQHSYEDIGETLELSSSQVKVYLHRARRTLRDRLQRWSSETIDTRQMRQKEGSNGKSADMKDDD